MTTQHPAIAAPAEPNRTPFEYQDSGSYGMDRAYWSQVRAVYARFGGKTERSTTKEQTTLYRMPSGVQLQGGKASDVNKKIGQQALRQIMQGVRRAGIPPILFLGAMAQHGVSFVSRSADVTRAQKWLEETKPDLTSVDSWKRGQTELYEWIKNRVELAPLKEGESVPTQRSYPYTIREAVELAGLEGKKATYAASQMAGQIKRPNGKLGQDLRAGGHLHEDKKGQRTFYHVDEPGAMMIARLAEKRYGPVQQEAPLPEAHPIYEEKPTETVAQQLERKHPEVPRPHITLDSTFISAAIVEYFSRRDMHPDPKIVYHGVSDNRFSAVVEFKFVSEIEK